MGLFGKRRAIRDGWGDIVASLPPDAYPPKVERHGSQVVMFGTLVKGAVDVSVVRHDGAPWRAQLMNYASINPLRGTMLDKTEFAPANASAEQVRSGFRSWAASALADVAANPSSYSMIQEGHVDLIKASLPSYAE